MVLQAGCTIASRERLFAIMLMGHEAELHSPSRRARLSRTWRADFRPGAVTVGLRNFAHHLLRLRRSLKHAHSLPDGQPGGYPQRPFRLMECGPSCISYFAADVGYGSFASFRCFAQMSAITPKATMERSSGNVGDVPQPDIAPCLCDSSGVAVHDMALNRQRSCDGAAHTHDC